VISISTGSPMLVDCDAILVLERGKVYDLGTHEELMQACDIYGDVVTSRTDNLDRAAPTTRASFDGRSEMTDTSASRALDLSRHPGGVGEVLGAFESETCRVSCARRRRKRAVDSAHHRRHPVYLRWRWRPWSSWTASSPRRPHRAGGRLALRLTLDAGIVREYASRAGDIVKKGQPLASWIRPLRVRI